ncbi:MAG: DUF3570 domain-containing protein [Betaproteobacteria bacterium]|nr:MAG: DUF3570 domain-containing protein [Betaproteobacteria bacterium]
MVAVAATEPNPNTSTSAAASKRNNSTGALLAAALALPGILPPTAVAQLAPDPGLIALKYLDYRDWQPGGDRIRVRTPSFYARKPLSDSLQAEGSIVYDSISGASPLYHNTLSGASRLGVTDYRTAGNAKLTKYFDPFAVGVGAAVSSERDYLSRALSLDVRISSDDRNRTYAFGVGGASDRINSTNGVAEGKERHTLDLLAGVTQALSPEAIVQSTVTYSPGHGYYSDPYKAIDIRPDHRRIFAWLTRYNQHLPWLDATVNLSYRYLHDSFGSSSHAAEFAWNQPLPDGWSMAPNLRYYTQSAADFYFDPPFAHGFVLGSPYSADARLSAFGALTSGVSIVKRLPDGWSFDVKLDFYRQRSDWRLGGDGSPGLEPFSARWIQTGISKTF